MTTTTIFISILGLGPPNGYVPCKVTCPQFSDHEIDDQETLHQHLLQRALKPDKTWVIGTIEAKNKYGKDLPHDKFLIIPKGQNEDEFWDIHSIITDALASITEETNIHIDLTHGFRVQPIFFLSSVRFFSRLHTHIHISDIWYSSFNPDTCSATLLSVSPLMELEDIASEAQYFLRTGISTGLIEKLSHITKRHRAAILQPYTALSEQEQNKIKGTLFKDDPVLHIITKKLPVALSQFSATMQINQTSTVQHAIAYLSTLAHELTEKCTHALRPLAQTLEKLTSELTNEFPNDDAPLWQWHLAIAQWCSQRELWQAALVHIQELPITRILNEAHLESQDRNMRQYVSDQLHALREEKNESWNALFKTTEPVREARNPISHAFCSTQFAQTDPCRFSASIKEKIESAIAFHQSCHRLPTLEGVALPAPIDMNTPETA